MCLLLDSLLHNWGLYFTTHTQPDSISSSDLEMVLSELEPWLRVLTLDDHLKAMLLEKNQKSVSRWFLHVVLACLLLFNLFLQCVAEMNTELCNAHKE